MSKRKRYLFLLSAALISIAVFNYVEVEPLPEPLQDCGGCRGLTSTAVFTIHDTGLDFQVASRKDTVGEVLLEHGIELYPQDSISPNLDVPLSSSLHIIINRKVFSRIMPIGFETLYVKDNNLLYGHKVVKQWGREGFKEETYLISGQGEQNSFCLSATPNKLCGSEIQILEEKILKNPIPKIIARGTKIVPTGFEEFGQASWCKPYSGWGYVAAHSTLKRGSRVLVTNLENGRQIVVKIVDWGPDRSVFPERVIDLSPEAFTKLGVSLKKGIIKQVKIEKIR